MGPDVTAPGAGVPQSPAQTREAAVTPDGVRLPPAAAAWTLVFRGTSVRGSHTVTVTDPPASPSPPRSLGPVARPQCTPGARPRSSLSDLPRLGTGAPNCPPLPSCSGVGLTQPPPHPLQQHIVCPEPTRRERETGRWSRRAQPPTPGALAWTGGVSACTDTLLQAGQGEQFCASRAREPHQPKAGGARAARRGRSRDPGLDQAMLQKCQNRRRGRTIYYVLF